MGQVRLCAVRPTENWLGTSKTTYRVGWMIWIRCSHALERRCLPCPIYSELGPIWRRRKLRAMMTISEYIFGSGEFLWIIPRPTRLDGRELPPRGKNMNFICFRIPEIELVKRHFVCKTGSRRKDFFCTFFLEPPGCRIGLAKLCYIP